MAMEIFNGKRNRNGLRSFKKKIADHIEGPVKIRNSVFVIWPSSMDFTFSTAA